MRRVSLTYQDFLEQKTLTAPQRGLSDVPELAGHLFRFQGESVAFGLRAGSWGCFLNTGLGKTICELEWSRHALEATNGKALVLTPLAVARQIEAEGQRFDYPVRVIRSQADAGDGINICNYDRLHLLHPEAFGAVALDEASILKNFTGAHSRALIEQFAGHRFRMAATATPAPNDHTELAQHAAFLGLLTRDEMLVRWFINDSNDTKAWRLKGHAVEPFFDWMASWARMAEHPRDLGDDVDGFDLPRLDIIRHQAEEPDTPITGGLFGGEVSATGIHDLKRQTIEARADVVAEVVAREPNEPWLIWSDTNYEQDAIEKRLDGGTFYSVRGDQSVEEKEAAIEGWLARERRHMLSKPSIMGWGCNFQFCARMIFAGRSFSYESFYQTVRRCWRFGQTRPVQIHLVVAEGEDAIGRVIDRKADDHAEMNAHMRAAMLRAIGKASARKVAYDPRHMGRLPAWMERTA